MKYRRVLGGTGDLKLDRLDEDWVDQSCFETVGF